MGAPRNIGTNYPEKIAKGQLDLLDELTSALLILRDCVRGYESGDVYLVGAAAVQLRSLVFESRKDATSLLRQIFCDYGHRLMVFRNDSAVPEPEIVAKAALIASDPFSVDRAGPSSREVPLEELFSFAPLRIEGRGYTYKFLVTTIANVYGGAHHARRVDTQHVDLVARSASGLWNPRGVSERLVMQFARHILAVGTRFIQEVVPTHWWMIVRISDPKEGVVLFRSRDRTSTQVQLKIDARGRWALRVIGYNAAWAELTASEFLDLTKWHCLSFHIELDSNLEAHLSLEFDGNTIAAAQVRVPILAIISDEDVMHIGADNQHPSPLEIDLGQHAISTGRLDAVDRAQMLIWATSATSNAEKYVKISADSWLTKPAGQRDFMGMSRPGADLPRMRYVDSQSPAAT